MKVTDQGIQFGEAWYSHEKITGFTASELNSGKCSLTARKYMEWVNFQLTFAPKAVADDQEVAG